MEETQTPQSSTDVLRENAPLFADLPSHLIKLHRDRLLAVVDLTERRVHEAETAYDDAADKPVTDHEIPEVVEDATDVEWLTRRAAEADRDLAMEQRNLALSERWLVWKTAEREFHEAYLRVNQLDHLVVGSREVGNDSILAILTLDWREAEADEAHAMRTLEIARQRLAHAKQGHKEVHAALRRAQRAAERESKKAGK